MNSDFIRGIKRRQLIEWGGIGAAGAAVGASLATAIPGHADPAASDSDIPPDTKPGGAYDKFVEKLADEDKFSGVVLLAHKGETILSRSYGMADQENEIGNHEDIAVNLSSASQSFLAVAVLQLVQGGEVALSDTVGTYLDGVNEEIAERVTIHHLLTSTSGLDAPEPDWERVFDSKGEVHEYHEQWAGQAELVEPPGSGSNGHLPGGGVGLTMAARIVEAVSGMTFWDYVHEHIFQLCGMDGSAFYTRQQWLEDENIAHPYMLQADGKRIDAVRNLDKGSALPELEGRNPARGFIGYASGDGFATAPDLVRFARALRDGTVLSSPYADLFTGAKLPGHGSTSYLAYSGPLQIVNGLHWVFGRGGGGAGGGANWNVYPATDWVGVVLTNYDDIPLPEILEQETNAILGKD